MDWLLALNWSKEHIEDFRVVGYAYIRQGKYDIALPCFEALNILDPENAYDAQTLGALYLQLNQPAKALKIFEKALTLETDHGPTLLNIAKALFLVGKKEDALRIANVLQNETDPFISSMAKALVLAYG